MSSTFDKVLEKLPANLPQLFVAMLEECCEKADNASENENERFTTALLAFVTVMPVLKGFIDGAKQTFDTDHLKIEYRGQTFPIRNDSTVYKMIEQISLIKL